MRLRPASSAFLRSVAGLNRTGSAPGSPPADGHQELAVTDPLVERAEEPLVQPPVEALAGGPEGKRARSHIVATGFGEERAKMARLEDEGVVGGRPDRRDSPAQAGSEAIPAVLAGPRVLGDDDDHAARTHEADHLLDEHPWVRQVLDEVPGD